MSYQVPGNTTPSMSLIDDGCIGRDRLECATVMKKPRTHWLNTIPFYFVFTRIQSPVLDLLPPFISCLLHLEPMAFKITIERQRERSHIKS